MTALPGVASFDDFDPPTAEPGLQGECKIHMEHAKGGLAGNRRRNGTPASVWDGIYARDGRVRDCQLYGLFAHQALRWAGSGWPPWAGVERGALISTWSGSKHLFRNDLTFLRRFLRPISAQWVLVILSCQVLL